MAKHLEIVNYVGQVARFDRGTGGLAWAAVRKGAGVATMAIGLILDAELAQQVVAQGKADLVALARPALDDPNFALHAVEALTGQLDYAFAPTPAKSGLDRLAQGLRHMKPA